MALLKKWRFSIQSAMILAFSLITLSVIATALSVAYRFTVYEVRSVAVDYVSQLISQLNGEIDRYVGYMEDVSEVVSKNSAVMRWIEADDGMGRAESIVMEDAVQIQMTGIANTRKDIANMGVFVEPDRAIFDTRGKQLNSFIDYKSTDWYQSAVGGDAVITSSHVQNVIAGRYDWVVTMSKPILHSSGRVLGVLMVDLNYSLINNLCESVDMGNRGYIYLVDREGNIIYHPEQQLIYLQIQSEHTDIDLGENSVQIVGSGESEKLYITNHSTRTGWTVVGVAYQDEILRNQRNIFGFYILIFIAFLAVGVILSAIICAAITKPLKRLVEAMQRVQADSLNTKIEINSPTEVASLSHAFNDMTAQLSESIRHRELAQEQRRKSELKALQAQINPHFLYNTLDSIIWMAENDKSEEVVEMTAALARLFRSSISESRELVPLAVEIANIRSYLTIQQMRYKEKLRFEINIPMELHQYQIPKLSLQPLVENAIYHGIKQRESGGCINLSGWLQEDSMVLEVADDGIGMTDEQIAGIYAAYPSGNGSGIGVKNVNDRIKLTYGQQYGLEYQSKSGKGTRVQLILPTIQGEGIR